MKWWFFFGNKDAVTNTGHKKIFTLISTSLTSLLFLVIAIVAIVTAFSPHLISQRLENFPLSSAKTKMITDVLQASTNAGKVQGEISFNLPVTFNENVFVDANASVSGNLTAPNIIYGLIAGENITITDGQNPTISATSGGVLSLQGQSGNLAFTAGSGISITNLSITNSDPGSAQKIFQNIKVGSSTITAGSNTDTLELIAGSGVSLSTNTSNKSITISNSAASGIITVMESGTVITNSANTLDFLGGDFDISEAPAGEANVQLASTLNSVTGVAGAFSTGTTLTVGSTFTLNSETFSDLTGSGLSLSGGALGINLTTTGGLGLTSSNSGLEVGASGLTLLKGCSDTQILQWNDTASTWDCATQSAVSGASKWTQTNGVVYPNISTLDVLLGGISTASAKFAFLNNASGTPVASISANSGANNTFLTGTGILGTTNAQRLQIGGATTGDIILSPRNDVAGSTIRPNVNDVTDLGLTNFNFRNIFATTYNSGSNVGQTLTNSSCVNTVGGIVVGTGVCPATTNFWNQNNGLLYPAISTVDFAIGGISSASAKFAVLNVNSGTPTASVSAGAGGATFLTATGNLQTTANQSLTLGGGATGNIVLSGFGAGIVHSNATGVLSSSALNLAGGASEITGTLPLGNGGTGLTGTPTNGQLLIGNGSGYTLATLTAGAGISITNGSGSITIAQSATSTSKWTQNDVNGTLYPNISTLDLLVGGVSSSSAKFAFLNNAGGTPTASISAGTANNFTSLSGNGILSTTNAQTLNLGSTSTGNIVIDSGSGLITLSDNTTLNGNFVVTGTSDLRGNIANSTGNLALNDNTDLTGNLDISGTLTSGTADAFQIDASGNITSTGTTGITLSGAGADLAFTGGGNNLISSTGTLQFGAATLTGTITGNTQNITGLGQLTVDNLRLDGNTVDSTAGDLILDSFSGTIRLADLTTNGVVYTSGGNGTLNAETQLSVARGGTGINASTVTDGQLLIGNDGTNGFSLATLTAGSGISITNGAGSITIAQTGGTASKWTQNTTDGTLYPNLSPLDLLVGGTSTASAKFAVLNNAGGTPTASLSAGITGGMYLTAAGTLQTTANQTLTFGGNTTGNIIINPRNSAAGGYLGPATNNVTDLGTSAIAFRSIYAATDVIVNGQSVCLANGTNCPAGATTYWDLSGNALTPKNAQVNDLLLGSTATASAEFSITGIAAGTPVASIAASTNGNGISLIASTATIQSHNLGTLTVGGSTTGNILLDSGSGLITLSDNTTLNGNFVVTGTSDLRGNIANSTGNLALNDNTDITGNLDISGTLTSGTADAFQIDASGNISTSGTTGITLSGAGADMLFDGGGVNTISSTGTLQIGAATLTGALTANSQNITGVNTFDFGTNNISINGTAISTSGNNNNLTLTPNGSGNIILSSDFNSGVLIGTSPTTAPLSVRGGIGANALAIFDQLNGGDIFSASASGTTRLTLSNGGNLNLIGGVYQSGGTSGQTVGTASCVTTTGGIVTGTGSCPAVAANDIWRTGNGTIFQGNTTQDLLIGGVATDSAKFAVLNINSGTPTASLSAGVAGGAFLTATGTLQTTARQSLTIGGGNTGNIVLPSFTGNNAVLYGAPGTGILSSATTNTDALCLMSSSGTNTPSWTSCPGSGSGASKWTLSGNVLYPNTITQQVGIGTTTAGSVISSFYVTRDLASGALGKALAIFNQTENQDIFTASASGTTRLTLSNGGNLNLIGGVYQSGGTSGQTVGTASCVTTTGGIVTGTGTCPAAAANFIWQTGNGTIFQGNTTQDLLLGGISTDSAKFAVTGINSTNNPVATIAATPSSGTTAGISLSGTGTIQGLNMNTLTLGGNITGNIVIDAGSGLITLSDNTTINGNTTITGTSDLRGNIANSTGNLSLNDNTDITGNLDVSGTLTSGTTNAFQVDASGNISTSGTTGLSFSSTGGISLTGGTISDATDGVDIADALEVSGLITANGGLTVPSGQTTTLASFTNDGGVIYTNSSGVLSQTGAGTASQCLIGGATPSWLSCATAAGEDWDFANGALSPKLASVADLLLGSAATTSAEFAITGINDGTPTATLSASTNGNGISLTGSSATIQSLRNNTLTIGGASTGNIAISPLNGGAGSLLTINAVTTALSGTTTLTASSLATIDSAASLGLDATTLTLGNGSAAEIATTTNGLTLNSGSNTLTIHSSDTTLTATGLTTLTSAATLDISATTLNLGAGSAATIGTISDDNLTLAPNGSGNVILTGDFDSQVLIGATGASTEFPLLVRSGIGSNATVAFDQLNSGDIFTASASGTTRLTLSNGGNLNLIGGVYQSGGTSGQTVGTASCVTTTGGIVTGTGTCPSVAANDIWRTGNGTIFQGNTTQDLLIGGIATDSAKFAVLNVNSGTPVASVSSGLSGTAAYLSANGILATSNKLSLTLGDTNTGNILLGTDTTARSITIGNATGTTTINIDTGTGGINFGDNANTKTIDIGGVTNSGTDTINIATNNTAADAIAIGNTNASTTFTLSGGDDWNLSATGILTLSASASQTNAIDITDTDYTNALSLADNNITGTAFSILATAGNLTLDASGDVVLDADGADIILQDGGSEFARFTNSSTDLIIDALGNDVVSNDRWTLGSQSPTTFATLDVKALSGTLSVATISGQTSFATLVVDNSGVGDIFTASTGGVAKFTIQNNGAVVSSHYTTAGGIFYGTATGTFALSAAGTSSECLIGGAVPSWSSCAAAAGDDWDFGSGALSPKFASVADLLLGGVATRSAKFAVTNINGSATPFASVSATIASGGSGNGITLGGDSTIQSLQNSSLTIGGNTTGNIILSPRNGSGRIGINTASPARDLEIASSTNAFTFLKFNPIPGGGSVAAEDWSIGSEELGFVFFNDTDSAYRMVIDESGNVGIGTTATNPDVGGFARGIEISGGGAGAVLTLTATAGKQFMIASGTTPSGLFFRDDTAGVYRMMIDGDGRVGINTTSLAPLATLDVRGNTSHLAAASASASTSFAALIADNTGSGDIFTASASGRARFSLSNGGELRMYDADASNYTGFKTPTNITSNAIYEFPAALPGGNYILQSNTSGVLSWIDPGTLPSSNFWDQLNGALVPKIVTQDLLIGGISTASARFHAYGSFNEGTTPAASISARSNSFAGLVVDNAGTGDIFTASSSGLNRFVIKNNGNIGIGSAAPNARLDVLSTTEQLRLSYDASNYTSFTIGTSGDITLDATGNNILSSDALNIGGAAAAAFNFFATNTGGNTLADGTSDLYIQDALEVDGNIRFDSATLTLGHTNFANCGVLSTSSNAITCGSSSGSNWDVANGVLTPKLSSVLDLLIGGTASSSARFHAYGSLNQGTTPAASISARSNSFAGLVVDNAGTGDIFTASSSGLNRFVILNNGNVGIGTAFPNQKLDIAGNATASGTLTLGGVFQSGVLGATVTYNRIGHGATSNGLNASNDLFISGKLEVDGSLFIDGNLIPGGTAGTVGWFQRNAGALAPTNIADDFLIGGTSTASATFRVTGKNALAGTAPVASISGNTAHAAFVVDNRDGGDLITASSSGETRFTIKQSGVVVIGNNTNGITFDYLNGGPLYAGLARPTKKIVLSAEYPGAIVTASGSASINGNMTSDASPSATPNSALFNYMNYYEWKSSQASLQEYQVNVRVTLPTDFSSWAPGGSAMQIYYNTNLPDANSNKFDVFIYNPNDDSPAIPVYFRTAQISSANRTWTTLNIPASELTTGTTQWKNASESAVIMIKMYSKNNLYTQIGDIVLNYLSKF